MAYATGEVVLVTHGFGPADPGSQLCISAVFPLCLPPYIGDVLRPTLLAVAKRAIVVLDLKHHKHCPKERKSLSQHSQQEALRFTPVRLTDVKCPLITLAG